jgi:hypothetical protein
MTLLPSRPNASAADRCVTADSLGRILVWSLPSLFSVTFEDTGAASPQSKSGPTPVESSGFADFPSDSTSFPPSPPPTPQPSRNAAPSFVEVVPPPKPDGDERGEERTIWVGLDEERILSLSAPRRDWTSAADVAAKTGAGDDAKAKIWSFDR